MRGRAEGRRASTAKSAPELVVLSREEAERYEPSLREICISISDPDAEPANVSARFVACLLYTSDAADE